MTAPFNLTNRFELLVADNPGSLPRVWQAFAALNIAPTTISPVRHCGKDLAITVTVQELAEQEAQTLKHKLKAVPEVKRALLEHMIN